MLVLKTLFFTLIAPGTLTVLVPYLLLSPVNIPAFSRWNVLNYCGLLLFSLGVAIYLWCAWDFISSGKGTPAPYDPPKVLVVRGLYKLVRNPMYVGVTTILLGEAVFFKSTLLFVYASVLFLGFHLRVIYYEEPTLKRLFDQPWEDYRKRVPRWIPKAGR